MSAGRLKTALRLSDLLPSNMAVLPCWVSDSVIRLGFYRERSWLPFSRVRPVLLFVVFSQVPLTCRHLDIGLGGVGWGGVEWGGVGA